MGSRSISCGVSKLPIHGGENIVYIPLKPRKTIIGNNISVPKASFFLNNNELYEAKMLPIFGEYNDAGSIENIEKNANIKFLEKKYNKNIDDIIKTINNNRSIFDEYSDLSKIWNIKIYKNNDLESLLKLGFIKKIENNIEFLYLKDLDLKLFNLDPSSEFKISKDYRIEYPEINHPNNLSKLFNENKSTEKLIIKKEIFIDDYVGAPTIQEILFQETKFVLGIKDKSQMKDLNELYEMSGFFVNREIYENLKNIKYLEFKGVSQIDNPIDLAHIKPIHLDKLGFVEQNDNNIYIKDDIQIFCDKWYNTKLLNAGTLKKGDKSLENIGILKKELSKYENQNFDFSLINDLYGVNLIIRNNLFYLKNEIEKFVKHENIVELDKEMSNKVIKTIERTIWRVIDNELNYLNNNQSLVNLYKNDLLNILLKDNDEELFKELVKNLDDFNNFEESIIAANILYIPSYCAYQEGAIEMNKYLNEITKNIIDTKLNDNEYVLEND